MLAELFTSSTRAEVMRILFDGMGHERYLREIEKMGQIGVNSIQKEIKHLLSMDLVMPGGSNLNLKLTIPILQAMRLLLERFAQQANWGQLQLNVAPQAAPAEAPKAEPEDKKNLH